VARKGLPRDERSPYESPGTKYGTNTAQQSGAICFKRHKGSKRRAALFRQLRASTANQTSDVKQQTFGNAYIAQGLR